VNRHAAFGLGIHRCAGSNLARMEMKVAIGEWLATAMNASWEIASTLSSIPELADVLGLVGRMKNAGDSRIGVVLVDDDDLLTKAPDGAYIEWGYPDAHGRFTPTVHVSGS